MNALAETKPRILVVDDDEVVLEVVENALEPLNLDVCSCRSVEDATPAVEEGAIAVALLDVRLPGQDGFSFAAKLRSSDETENIPILFLTGLDREEERNRGYALGAVDYLLKPIDKHILRSKVSVFVDLFVKSRRLIEKEKEALQLAERARQADELERLLQSYASMSSEGSSTGVTRALAENGPLRKREKEEFDVIERQYEGVLHSYLDSLIVRKPKPRREMIRLVGRLGAYGAGPRDLIDVHSAAIAKISRGSAEQRAVAVAVEGRLLALEMMGLLVEYYRVGMRPNRHNGIET